MIPRLEAATGLDAKQLTEAWHASIHAAVDERVISASLAARVVAGGAPRRRDGCTWRRRSALMAGSVMFISERDRLSLDLFMADAVNGANVRKIVSTAADPHFDSLQYIHSSGAWDPAGQRFAIAALSGGEPVLTILDMERPVVAAGHPPRRARRDLQPELVAGRQRGSCSRR